MVLLVHRDICICGASPDGIFDLYENKTFHEPNLLGLCVLEIKTRTTMRTATQLDEVNISDDVQFQCCRAGSHEFNQLFTELTYHS